MGFWISLIDFTPAALPRNLEGKSWPGLHSCRTQQDQHHLFRQLSRSSSGRRRNTQGPGSVSLPPWSIARLKRGVTCKASWTGTQRGAAGTGAFSDPCVTVSGHGPWKDGKTEGLKFNNPFWFEALITCRTVCCQRADYCSGLLLLWSAGKELNAKGRKLKKKELLTETKVAK